MFQICSEQQTRVHCAVCSNLGLWGYVAHLTWDFAQLDSVHVCPTCLHRWTERHRLLERRGCQSWDIMHGRGSMKHAPDMDKGFIPLALVPYVGASFIVSFFRAGRPVSPEATKSIVAFWLMNRGELKLRRQSALR